MKKVVFILLAMVATVPMLAQEPIEVVEERIVYHINLDTNDAIVYSMVNGGFYTYANIHSSVQYEGNDYPVTSIREKAFYNCSDLTSVTIPNSVIKIGMQAFASYIFPFIFFIRIRC